MGIATTGGGLTLLAEGPGGGLDGKFPGGGGGGGGPPMPMKYEVSMKVLQDRRCAIRAGYDSCLAPKLHNDTFTARITDWTKKICITWRRRRRRGWWRRHDCERGSWCRYPGETESRDKVF
jgi:hypothetical protein